MPAHHLSAYYPVQSNHVNLVEAIAACGFQNIDSRITAHNFSIDGEVIVSTNVALFHPGCPLRTLEITANMDQHGAQPANLLELLAFRETYPDKCSGMQLLALRSSWVDSANNRWWPCAFCIDNERSLELHCWYAPWSSQHYFFCVRKM